MIGDRTPTFSETIQELIEAKLMEIHTSTPAKIVSYDYAKNLAVVQPLIKRKYKNEDSPIELPTISNVPVAFPRMGNAWVRFPVNVDDEGSIKIMERSIDKWLSSGGSVDPDDPRKFSLSDAVFMPGLNSQVNPMASTAAEDSLQLQLGTSFLEITTAGKFKVTDGTNELFDLLVELTTEIGAGVDAMGTPWNAGTIAKFEAIKAKFELMKG